MLLPLHLNGLNLDSGTAVAVITGTSFTESQIVSGGQTIVITLTNDTWLAAGTGPIGSIANTQALIDGLVSAQSETNGFNAERTNIAVTDIARTSSTVATLTLPVLGTYEITADETLTWTIPAAVLTGASPVVATPTIGITAQVGAFKIDYFVVNQVEAYTFGSVDESYAVSLGKESYTVAAPNEAYEK